MKKTVVLAALALAAVVSAPAADYTHKIEAKGVTFEWTVDGANLNAQLTAKTTGWVGVGFNPTKDMLDASFVIGAVKEGQAKAALFIGTSPSAHSKEVEQGDVTNIGGSEADGVTKIRFTIPLVSKNPKVKPIATDKDIRMLLAYAADDSVKTKHRDRAELTVNLSTGAFK
ncbi:MAG: DOMON domain-containing protein [Verrucomicrobia bacterium]|nr:DOMON domain-containing protein [Verrucomicrobiota bacterium]